MAKVTKIKAKSTTAKTAEKPKKAEVKKAEVKKTKAKNTEKKPFILWRPLVYLGRYLRDSWREIRQVRWPNRKSTWKMVLAVVIYTVIFMVFISVLDLIFSQLAGLIFGNN